MCSRDRNIWRRCLGGPALQGRHGFLQPEGCTSRQGHPSEAGSRDYAATNTTANDGRTIRQQQAGDACFAGTGCSDGAGHG
jgi:hypothetical protein